MRSLSRSCLAILSLLHTQASAWSPVLSLCWPQVGQLPSLEYWSRRWCRAGSAQWGRTLPGEDGGQGQVREQQRANFPRTWGQGTTVLPDLEHFPPGVDSEGGTGCGNRLWRWQPFEIFDHRTQLILLKSQSQVYEQGEAYMTPMGRHLMMPCLTYMTVFMLPMLRTETESDYIETWYWFRNRRPH